MASSTEAALESLRQLGSTDPPVWIAPKPELSEAVRAASKLLFACLKPHTPKSPFDQLLTDGFDAEQIWQQIDLQTQPLLSNLRREVKKFEKNPDEHFSLKDALGGGEKKATGSKEIKQDDFDDMDLDMEDEDGDDDEDEDEDDDDEGTREKGGSEEKSGSEAEGESDEEDMERDSEGEENGGVEDKFLKIKHLQKYLEEDEAREYGYESKNKKAKKDVEIDNEDEEDADDDDEEDELGLFNAHDDEDEDADKLENARYTDFFVANKRKGSQKRSKLKDLSPDDEQETNKSLGNQVIMQRKDSLSTHEKELEKLQSKIKQMEQANLDAKVWTMQGEVTAAQRQKNSALEVHLDFEHNMRPAPVVTEEVTASIEDMIKNRVIEGRFDDVQKPPSLPSKAPREVKELDESKSKKGLAEVYEEEYVQKTDPAFTPLSFSDEQKKEASMLFKKLCLKLDALSHFHFTPKPVIEDMSIQVNIPALAMEEIAPVAISDAAMLAPEEVFAGKGDITEEAELTKAERKRRRANKKRKFKAEAAKRTVRKAGDRVLLNQSNGKGE